MRRIPFIPFVFLRSAALGLPGSGQQLQNHVKKNYAKKKNINPWQDREQT